MTDVARTLLDTRRSRQVLKKFEAVGVSLPKADLSGLKADFLSAEDADFQEASFADAHLMDSDFVNATLEGTVFNGAMLFQCSFRQAHAKGSQFIRAEIVFGGFRGASLQNAVFEYAHLDNVNFSGANLDGADLNGAHGEGVNFSGTRLRGASLASAKLPGSDFSGADLSGADLSSGDFSGCKFHGATMRDVEWRGAVTTGAEFDEGEPAKSQDAQSRPAVGLDAAGARAVAEVVTGILGSTVEEVLHDPDKARKRFRETLGSLTGASGAASSTDPKLEPARAFARRIHEQLLAHDIDVSPELKQLPERAIELRDLLAGLSPQELGQKVQALLSAAQAPRADDPELRRVLAWFERILGPLLGPPRESDAARAARLKADAAADIAEVMRAHRGKLPDTDSD